MASSAGVVYTGLSGNMSGDGHGAGAVLQNNSAAINQNNIENVLRQSQIELQKQKLAKEKADAQRKAWDDIQPKIKEGVWSVEKPLVDDAINAYREDLTTLFDAGDDPTNPYSEAGKWAASERMKIENMQAQAIEAEKFMVSAVDALNKDDGKYDKGYTAEYFKEYTDPETTPERRQQMRREESPFKLNFDDEAFEETITPKDSAQIGGYEVKDPKAIEVLFNSMALTPDGRAIIDSGKLKDETDEAFLARKQASIAARYPKQKIKVSASSNNSNNSDGTSGDAAKYTVGRDNTDNKAPVRVSFGHTRENPVTMELVTNDNQKRNVNVIGLHQVDGKWVIDVTYEDAEGDELKEVISADKFDGSPQSKDTHNYQRISDYMGGDFVEKVYGGSGGNFNQIIDPN